MNIKERMDAESRQYYSLGVYALEMLKAHSLSERLVAISFGFSGISTSGAIISVHLTPGAACDTIRRIAEAYGKDVLTKNCTAGGLSSVEDSVTINGVMFFALRDMKVNGGD